MVLKLTTYEMCRTGLGYLIRSKSQKIIIKGGKIMKEEYLKPNVEFEDLKTVDVISTRVNDDRDPADNDVPFGS